jgi:ferredoxin
MVLHVPADQTLGNVLHDAGALTLFSCEEGHCGS